jgi:putative aldouronate transport system substrate-binding protein
VNNSYPDLSLNNTFLKALKDELGVTLRIENSGGLSDAQMDEKIGVMVASGDLPDLMVNRNGNSLFITSGNSLALDDWLSIAPNIAKHVEGYRKQMSHIEDGKLYVLPNYNRFYGQVILNDYDGPAFFVQKRVLEDAGFPEIKTLDDLFNMVEAFAKKYPTTKDGASVIPFSINGSNFFRIANPPLHLMNQANNGDYAWSDTEGATLFGVSDSAHRYFAFLNQKYNAGVMDQEAFTQTNDQFWAKVATGRVLCMFEEHWNINSSQALPALREAGMYEYTYVATGPTWNGTDSHYRDRPVMNLEQGFSINKNSPNAAYAVALINTMLEEKWQKLMSWGVEGKDYLVDANGRYYRTQEMSDNANKTSYTTANFAFVFWDSLPKIQGTYADGNASSPGLQPEEWQASLVDYDKQFLAKAGKPNWGSFLNDPPPNPVWYPLWTISLPDGSEAALVHAEYVELLTQYYARAVTQPNAASFENVWNQLVTENNKLNNKATLDYINQQARIRIADWAE